MPSGLVLIALAPILKVSPIAIHRCDVGCRSVRLIDGPRLIVDRNHNAHIVIADTSTNATRWSDHRRSLIDDVLRRFPLPSDQIRWLWFAA